jgi:hypothetical protein
LADEKLILWDHDIEFFPVSLSTHLNYEHESYGDPQGEMDNRETNIRANNSLERYHMETGRTTKGADEPGEEFEPPLDKDIAVYVKTLREGGIETYESCQGGEGHSYLRPAVRFHGGKGEGFRALAIAQQHGFRVSRLNRMWSIIDDEPTGPYWEMVFWDHK